MLARCGRLRWSLPEFVVFLKTVTVREQKQTSACGRRKKGLNKGRTVGKIEGIFGGGSMFKLAGAVSKHLK